MCPRASAVGGDTDPSYCRLASGPQVAPRSRWRWDGSCAEVENTWTPMILMTLHHTFGAVPWLANSRHSEHCSGPRQTTPDWRQPASSRGCQTTAVKQRRVAQHRATMRPAGWLNRGAGSQDGVPPVPFPSLGLAPASGGSTGPEVVQCIGQRTFSSFVLCAVGTAVLTWRVK